MAEPTRDETAVIVFEGSINPAIITAHWLSQQDLVQREESAAATVRFMDDDFSRFDVSHFRVEARRDRITVAPTKALETFGPVADFMGGIFDVLIHTPIRAVALSRVLHVELGATGWAKLNASLVGGGGWSSILDAPSVRVMSVTGPGAHDGSTIEVTVEPSQFTDEQGVYIVATERTEIGEEVAKATGARKALETLDERWQPWLDQADAIIEKIVAIA